MDINLVIDRNESGWILGKFAFKLQEYLSKFGCAVKISEHPDPDADVNHFLYHYIPNDNKKGIDTLMITHVDEWYKWKRLKKDLQNVTAGICMSSHTLKVLRWSGFRRNKLLYINPAHDSIAEVPKIRIGFFSNIHLDGRKREYVLINALKKIDVRPFHFVFMGVRWEETCKELEALDVSFTLYDGFDYDTYNAEMKAIDYLLYTGNDEGSMSYLDAILNNKKTIVTAQGFHRDISGGITFSFKNSSQLKSIFRKLSTDYLNRTRDIQLLTWENYSLKHFQVWQYLLQKKAKGSISDFQGSGFRDGLKSLYKGYSPKIFLIDDLLFYRQKLLLKIKLFKVFSARHGMKNAIKRVFKKRT